MALETINVFLASSAELKEDRDAFRLFISVENDRLHQSNIYLKLIQWEYFLNTMSDTRLQDRYNKAIVGSNLLVSLFHTKAGKYTTEEFDIAYKLFKDTGKPMIWTYFKELSTANQQAQKEEPTLTAFKKKIDLLGHFYTTYRNMDSLKYQFKLQLDYILPQLSPTGKMNDLFTVREELRQISQTAEKIYNINHIDKAEFS
jgi:hypothetical protein